MSRCEEAKEIEIGRERGEGISELSAQPTQWAELKAGRSKIEDRGDRGAGRLD